MRFRVRNYESVDPPVPIDLNLCSHLDFFRDRDLSTRSVSSLVQVTRAISEHDFQVLTGRFRTQEARSTEQPTAPTSPRAVSRPAVRRGESSDLDELADEAAQQEGLGAARRSIEDVAVAFIIEIERAAGRRARDIRGRGRGDVESEGRLIEVKAFSDWGLRSTGLLLFTPPQIREGLGNPNYYVYVVENIAQADSAAFEVRVLHGDDLRRLFADAKPQRSYVAVRKADYERLGRADGLTDS